MLQLKDELRGLCCGIMCKLPLPTSASHMGVGSFLTVSLLIKVPDNGLGKSVEDALST